MPDWISQALQMGVVAVLTAIGLGLYRRWAVRRRRAALQIGKSTSFEAFIRGTPAPYPRRWRYGRIFVGVGVPTWKPRFSLRRRPIDLPASATVLTVRRVSGLSEAFWTSPNCHVLTVSGGDVKLELAVLDIDLPTALEALASGTGGAWRVPLPSLTVPVE